MIGTNKNINFFHTEKYTDYIQQSKRINKYYHRIITNTIVGFFLIIKCEFF